MEQKNMIVSHKNKFIFIKTAKTAGTSMIIYMAQFCDDGDLITNLKKEDMEYGESLGVQFPRGFMTHIETYKLSVWKMIKRIQSDQMVKKTLDRRVKKNLSAYSAKMYLKQEVWNNYFKFCFERDPFDKAVSLYYWHTRNLIKRPDINEYIQNIHQSKLSNWHLYTINDQIVVDFVGRYESLDKDIRIVTKKLGLPDYSLPKAKSNTREIRQHYSQILNNESRSYIEKICAKEIEEFKYNWVNR